MLSIRHDTIPPYVVSNPLLTAQIYKNLLQTNPLSVYCICTS